MKTTITTGHLKTFLELLEQLEVTPERFQQILQSGLLADIFNPALDFRGANLVRDSLKKILGLSFQVTGIFDPVHLIMLNRELATPLWLIDYLAKKNLRPLNRWELRLFKDQHPEVVKLRNELFGYDDNYNEVPSIRERGQECITKWYPSIGYQYFLAVPKF